MEQKFLFLLIQLICTRHVVGLLFPRESESRDVKDLSGRWKFRVDDSTDRNQSFREQWWEKPLHASGHVIDMPVPASYNDITQDSKIRDFVGWAWYETTFFASASWKSSLAWLQVGSAHYNSIVWLNSIRVGDHSGGHLPFEFNVTNKLNYGATNRLTIAVNNTLTPTTLPPGTVNHYSKDQGYPDGYFTQKYDFDFFNYAGIHRPVKLYTTPHLRVSDIFTYTQTITQDPSVAAVNVFQVNITDAKDVASGAKSNAGYNITVVIKDAEGVTVANGTGQTGYLYVYFPKLWWPVGMSSEVGYLYTLEVYTSAPSNGNAPAQIDVYRMPIGLRTIEVDGTQLKINGKPFYFLGVGKHEDWDVRGKGFDWSMVVKDFNLLAWLGANSFRTSHYPYSEEIMQMCDERGIVVIDECPAVGMRSADNFVNETLLHHQQVVGEMVSRDRNHPSVVMWSVANEPLSSLPQAAGYFKTVLDYARSLDPSRPVTFVCNAHYDKDVATPYVDVVSINKYEGWYDDPGQLDVVEGRLKFYIEKWHQTRSKPIIHMEWGAGAIAGFHDNPSVMFTEDYLVDLMNRHFAVFDELRNDTDPFLIGEMIWNFADFNTAQGTNRVQGNKKGLFTRSRAPKWPAYVIRERYKELQNQNGITRNRNSRREKHWERNYDVFQVQDAFEVLEL